MTHDLGLVPGARGAFPQCIIVIVVVISVYYSSISCKFPPTSVLRDTRTSLL